MAASVNMQVRTRVGWPELAAADDARDHDRKREGPRPREGGELEMGGCCEDAGGRESRDEARSWLKWSRGARGSVMFFALGEFAAFGSGPLGSGLLRALPS